MFLFLKSHFHRCKDKMQVGLFPKKDATQLVSWMCFFYFSCTCYHFDDGQPSIPFMERLLTSPRNQIYALFY
jgi:hypothetical protein